MGQSKMDILEKLAT